MLRSTILWFKFVRVIQIRELEADLRNACSGSFICGGVRGEILVM